ncbi:hypothetical protein EAF04_005398 [Stromatinia cepivora]|nr:hypothetical protein EAF04_005398 [Stromatinia cepivora]
MVPTESYVSTLPSSQQAIVQDASGKAKFAEDVPVPPLLPGTILVKTIAVAIQLFLLVPPGFPPEQAATLGTALATNCLALWDTLRLTASPDSIALKPFPVLVYRGSTTAGTEAIQLLRLSGLEPITTCSPHNTDLVHSHGATAVFDYTASRTIPAIRELTGGRLDHALDCIVDPDSVACSRTAIGRVGGTIRRVGAIP